MIRLCLHYTSNMKIDLEEFQKDILNNYGGSFVVDQLPDIWIDRLLGVYESFDNNEEGVTLAAPMYAVLKNEMSELKVSELTLTEEEVLHKLFFYYQDLIFEKQKRKSIK